MGGLSLVHPLSLVHIISKGGLLYCNVVVLQYHVASFCYGVNEWRSSCNFAYSWYPPLTTAPPFPTHIHLLPAPIFSPPIPIRHLSLFCTHLYPHPPYSPLSSFAAYLPIVAVHMPLLAFLIHHMSYFYILFDQCWEGAAICQSIQ